MKFKKLLTVLPLIFVTACSAGSNDPYGKTFTYSGSECDWKNDGLKIESAIENYTTLFTNNLSNINWDSSSLTVPTEKRSSVTVLKEFIDYSASIALSELYSNYSFAFSAEEEHKVTFTNGSTTAEYTMNHAESDFEYLMKDSDGNSKFGIEPYSWYNGKCTKSRLTVYTFVIIGTISGTASKKYSFPLNSSYKGLSSIDITYYANFVC